MMNRKLISGCFFSLFVFLVVFIPKFGFAQVDGQVQDTLQDKGKLELSDLKKKEKVKILPYNPTGIRIGVDLVKPILYAIDQNRMGVEASLDLDFRKNLFAVLEGGWERIRLKDSLSHYQGAGPYFRMGIDYNLLKMKNPKDGNAVFVGLRYGFSFLNHRADNIILTDTLWGSYQTSLPPRLATSHWAEILFGVKGEVYKNLFIGWSLRLRFVLSRGGADALAPYIIPGYGRSTNGMQAGGNFYIYYKISFPKKAIKTPSFKK